MPATRLSARLGAVLEVRLPVAAHIGADTRAVGRYEHLAVDHRRHALHTRQLLQPVRDRRIVRQRALHRADGDVALHAEDAAQQLGAEAVHHRHDDDQRRRRRCAMPASENAGDDGDESLFPARAQIPEGDQTLERGKDHAPSRCSAASTLSSTFSPVLRFFISTWPLAAPRGPTTSCHGRPIRSISANLAPARSSRSS